MLDMFKKLMTYFGMHVRQSSFDFVNIVVIFCCANLAQLCVYIYIRGRASRSLFTIRSDYYRSCVFPMYIMALGSP